MTLYLVSAELAIWDRRLDPDFLFLAAQDRQHVIRPYFRLPT